MEIGNTYTNDFAFSRNMAQYKVENTVNDRETTQVKEEEKQTAFSNTQDLMQYLSHTYDTVKMGMVKISGS